MKGWKTWLAAFGCVVIGMVMIAAGYKAIELKEMLYGLGAQSIMFGFGLIGIGHKVEKASAK